MIETIVAIVASIIGIFIYSRVQKSSADSGQRELEIKTAVTDEKVKNINRDIQDSEKQEKEDVKKIEADQNKKLANSDLVDWFRNRKG